MKLEAYISAMMTINVKARLWHWTTSVAQHHVVYESFLNQNQTSTDSFVESAMGNDLEIDFSKVGVASASLASYSPEASRKEISSFRALVGELKKNLAAQESGASEELITVLDDVTELCSKTLYLLKLK